MSIPNIDVVSRYARSIADYERRGDTKLRDQARRQALEYVDTNVPRNARDFAIPLLKGRTK